MKAGRYVQFLCLALLGLTGIGCQRSPGAIIDLPEVANSVGIPTLTPFQPLQPTVAFDAPESLPVPVPTIEPQLSTPSAGIPVWVDPRLPDGLLAKLALPPEFSAIDPDNAGLKEKAPLRLEVGEGQPLSRWVYALVTPFPTIETGVSMDELRSTWQGAPVGPFAGRSLLMDENTLSVFSTLWGAPADGSVIVLAKDELLGYAWDHQPAWALVPFEALEARWRVLEVDGLSPVRKNFDSDIYPLSAPVVLNGDPQLVAAISTLYGSQSGTPVMPFSNRDPSRLTTVILTGVTALVRATAFAMEQRGVTYPARDVGAWLREADITHISNEVPFAQNCPFPDPVQPDMRFCSAARYIGLLEDVGTDIVELTGDHFQDYGREAMYYTLDLYRERGWLYYGGGADLRDARQAVSIEHNGNRLAFIGCNAKGGGYAQAGPNRPGAVVCNYEWMESEIAKLRSQGYLPIATFQHFEYYTYKAQPSQVRDFQRLARAGAVIVSGSQAHQPQAFEFLGESLIHYGLGNLFFDQYDVSQATRQGFIDRHVFYNGRHISTELLPILFVDYARPRPMTPVEQGELLRTVFRASGW
jgi:poly-gamma-glutamate synthesis protein (capsule biosynthesis protein)